MDFVLDDDTPVVEQKEFKDGDGQQQRPKGGGPATLLGLNSSSSSGSSSNSGDTDSSSSGEDVKNADATKDMSNSYHEIFGGGAAAAMADQSDRLAPSPPPPPPPLPSDSTAGATTDYLTSKLVADSLRWRGDDDEDDGDDDDVVGNGVSRRHHRSVDPSLLLALERDARHLSTSLDALAESLSGVLRGASALTVDAAEAHRDAVCKTCDEADGNIKCMYQLMAKVEEVNKSFAPARALGDRLKDIRRLLDALEAAVPGSSSTASTTAGARIKSAMS